MCDTMARMASTATARHGATRATKDQLLAGCDGSRARSAASRGWSTKTATASTSSRRSRAIQAALDKVALGLLDDHAHHCVIGAETAAERDEKTDELMAAVGRSCAAAELSETRLNY